MSDDETALAIGRAFQERRGLLQKVACLNDRLQAFGNALQYLTANPDHAESIEVIEAADDPREQWARLKTAHARLSQLDTILK